MTAIAGEDNIALVANFTFVARDSQTQKAAPVNYLVPETEEEKHLYALSEARAAEKKKQCMQQHGKEQDGEGGIKPPAFLPKLYK